MKADAFKTTVGYEKSKHENNYVDKQVGKNKSTVAPFTLMNMLAIEVGEDKAKEVAKKLSEQVANSEFANYLNTGEITREEIEALRKNVEEKVIDQMGAVGDVLQGIDEIPPDWWLEMEDNLQSRIAGAMGDDAREVLANFEINEPFDNLFCEEIVG